VLFVTTVSREATLSRGAATRQTILQHAAGLASQLGLEGLSIGRLAEDLRLSKSGLFAHFQSKEALQLQVLDFAAARFVDTVVKPTLAAPRGEPRVRAAFERWLEWPRKSDLPGGCFFVAASIELDDRPGPVREKLVRLQRDWLDTLAGIVRTAIAEGDFREDVDPEQFAHELYGVMLVGHHAARLLRDPQAGARTRAAFDALVARARRSPA
jgi:AcrR family transcriptional regulator